MSEWKYRTPTNYLAVDPERGANRFPPGQLPRSNVTVTYY